MKKVFEFIQEFGNIIARGVKHDYLLIKNQPAPGIYIDLFFIACYLALMIVSAIRGAWFVVPVHLFFLLILLTMSARHIENRELRLHLIKNIENNALTQHWLGRIVSAGDNSQAIIDEFKQKEADFVKGWNEEKSRKFLTDNNLL